MRCSVTTDAGLQPREDLFLVEGLFCAACAATVEARLARIAGVEDAAVDFASGAALVRWSPERQDPAAVVRLVDRLGYHARRPDAPAGREGRRDPERGLRLRLAVALFFGMWTMLPSIGLYLDAAPDARVARGLAWAAAGFSLPVVAWAGRPFYAMGLATLRAGAPGIDALVTLGVLGAVLLSGLSLATGGSDVYFEVAVALVTLQLLARLVDLRVARAGRDALARVLDLRPPRVRRETEDGHLESVALDAAGVGDVLLVEDGDTLAVDGTVIDGDALVDRSLLTGEATPVPTGATAAVHAGERVVDGTLRVRVERPAGSRRIDGLARQVRTLLTAKPPWQRVVDRVARHFLLLATGTAGLGAAIAVAGGAEAMQAAVRALAVFVVACPCALSLAAPLPGLVAARRGAEQGILLRDLRAITSGAAVDVVFVDKTGTLTTGRPSVRALRPAPGVPPETLLRCAARAELRSRHPFAAAILAEARGAGLELAPPARARFEALPARGVRVSSPEGTVRVGSAAWLASEGLPSPPETPADASRVWVAKDATILGAIELQDALRPGATQAVAQLEALGVRVVLLSGDAVGPVEALATRLGVEGRARCTPEDKVRAVDAARAAGASTAFVGDGLNDGPAIAAAELGIAVEEALDGARTASAVALLQGGIERVPEVLALTRGARRLLRQNVAWALLYNACAVPAALAGFVHPAVAAVAMALSSLTVALNAQRLPRPAAAASPSAVPPAPPPESASACRHARNRGRAEPVPPGSRSTLSCVSRDVRSGAPPADSERARAGR